MSALITFTLFEAAYFSEIMRAGIQSIPRGQVSAGYALGLRYWQVMSYVILPQAFRNMLPVLLTQTIILFQDTSLVYVLSITDFLGAASKIAQRDGRPVEMYLFAAVVYFAICFALSHVSGSCRRGQPSFAEATCHGPNDRHPVNVSKWYGTVPGPDDCTTTSPRARSSWCAARPARGKSTLIKCVNGLEPFQKGDIMRRRRLRSTIPRPICRSCARASAWCSSISSCSRT